jgi:hypothetical protein
MLERHAFGTTPRAGKFAASADIPALIRETLRDGTIRPGNADNPLAFVYEHHIPNVGVNTSGRAAHRVRVVLDNLGAFLTAFPF